MNLLDRLLTLPQFVAPQHRLSSFAWSLARAKNKTFKNLLIRAFLRCYPVDMSEALGKGVDDYESFNDFFTRALDPVSRPLSSGNQTLASPADGVISQLGDIRGECLLQAKGRYYTLTALLAGDEELAEKFSHGSFATIYLAPHNYHRVHAPLAGTVTKICYVPGRLFSVNNRTVGCVDELFARNERIILEMATDAGSIAVIFVGAMLVASMELVAGDITAAIRAAGGNKQPFLVDVKDAFSTFEQGAEIGRFNMGSTVIVLAEAGRLKWAADLAHQSQVRIGQAIGSYAA